MYDDFSPLEKNAQHFDQSAEVLPAVAPLMNLEMNDLELR